jgi:hypothetical protein
MASSMTGWGGDLAQLLSGREQPLSVKLEDLGGEWRRVTIHGGAGASGNVEVNVSGSTEGSTSQNNILGMLSGGQTSRMKPSPRRLPKVGGRDVDTRLRPERG